MKCQFCDREVVQPFQCSYCHGYFCAEHRLPESHSCLGLPKKPPFWYWKARAPKPPKPQIERPVERTIPISYGRPKKKSRKWDWVIIGALLLCVILIIPYFGPQLIALSSNFFSKLFTPTPTITATSTPTTTTITPMPTPTRTTTLTPTSSPTPTLTPISTYSHEELVNYALSLINKDRTKYGLSNVSLSSIDCAQEHAENMLAYHFFSHWDTNGYKPYMRYTLAGGQGVVSENVAWYPSYGPFDAKEAIEALEWGMMYDDAMWDWGHRDNILNPFHNKVSIGIAYDDYNLFLVQDFEDDYINWSTFFHVNENGDVTLSGDFVIDELSVKSIVIFFDSKPMNLTPEQLEESPYSGSYSIGTLVGQALPPRYRSVEGITITAQTWIQKGKFFQIEFNLSHVFNKYGEGVYTLCLLADSHYLTNYSLWYDGFMS